MTNEKAGLNRRCSILAGVIGVSLVGVPHGYADHPDLFVTDLNSDSVLRFDGATGACIGEFTSGISMQGASGLAFGPSGDLYVAVRNTHNVLRFDGESGEFIDQFVPPQHGGLLGPRGIVFGGADGHLYVASGGAHWVAKYDSATGDFIEVFASGGGLQEPEGIVFGPDGDLYVASSGNGRVLRYHGVTGEFIEAVALECPFANPGPIGVAFGPDGALYISEYVPAKVWRWDGQQCAQFGCQISFPVGLVFGLDDNLYVTSLLSGRVDRFNWPAGTCDSFVTSGSCGLLDPTHLIFRPGPPGCHGDLDGDGNVGAGDLLALLGSWGPCKGCPADFDFNGNVGTSDLIALLGNWGPCR